MAEKQTRNIKKKYGKVLTIESITRAVTLDDDKAGEIAKYIENQRVVTPQELANKQGIRVSLARKILNRFVDDGALELKFKNGANEIYSK